MLTFIIHHTPTEDSVTVGGETIDAVRENAFAEMRKRGWKEADCWSEQL